VIVRNAGDRPGGGDHDGGVDVKISPETPADRDAIRDVVSQAFAHQRGVADLVDLIRASPQCVPELSLVARRAGKVVGHVMLSHADVVATDGTRRQVLTLSPLAVAPQVQRQGIGSELVRAGLQRADQLGAPLVLLEGSPAYYPRFGFEVSTRHGIAIDLPSWAPPEAAMVYRLTAYDETIRGKLEYPPAFATLG
jgi:putative acetyltransferase